MKRLYHTYDEWECYPMGFYEARAPEMSDRAALARYANFLKDTTVLQIGLTNVLGKWKNSCEHYLTNVNMNRIAWLLSAAACVELGIPQRFRTAIKRLSKAEQDTANQAALYALNYWLEKHGEPATDLAGAGINAKVDLY
jgi:hypothetical protein